MTTKFYALLTNQGAAKLANAAALGTKIQITEMAVGDGGGTLPTPDASQTRLVNEKRRAALNSLSIDAVNSSQIIAEQVIPENEGGFWIREIGLFDADGDMVAVANCAETYKPQLQEGSGRTQTIRMILIVNSTAAVTLKIDPSVVLATRKYVDDKVIEVRAYADGLMEKHLAAADPHPQYAPKASPTFTGTPKAPTPAAGNNTTQLATTAFVQAALAALTGAAPAALDTLKELADALGNDPHFSATVLNQLAGKMDIAKNGSDIADVAAFLKNLGLGEGSALPVGVPIPWSSSTPPTGWLKCNGAVFTASQYPKLALAYPDLKLPDLRGEFIRGWDDGRGVDSGRVLLSAQGDAIRNITGEMDYTLSSLATSSGAIYNKSTGARYVDRATVSSNPTVEDKWKDRIVALDVSRVVPTASENRPRNVAFNYIVRAA
ncbi:phage tail-collar fiber domain-containing protein [Mixta calida]|uniref:phage tail-collar fiber domain-containing protein n=2 Tax=Mixta calida TaxID=665913 RepID=UPI00289FBB1B|nr:phage tail protein [Mixta calida]